MEPGKTEVVVTDIRMPFGSMVLFILKWTLAAIPAFLLLFLLAALLPGVGIGLWRTVTATRSADDGPPFSSSTSPESPSPRPPLSSEGAAPITGTTHEVRMVGDEHGYRFEPANLTVRQGDGITFTMVSGGPHNVAFDAAGVPADVKAQLDANISERMGELASAMKMNPGESITVSFANVRPGTYDYDCTPHVAMGMRGTITVR